MLCKVLYMLKHIKANTNVYMHHVHKTHTDTHLKLVKKKKRRVLFPDTSCSACISAFTCCLLLGVYGRRVDTWNMIS